MLLLVEQRMDDAKERTLDESMHMVRRCKTLAEEDSWSGLNQVRKLVRQTDQGNWNRTQIGVKRIVWDIRISSAGKGHF